MKKQVIAAFLLGLALPLGIQLLVTPEPQPSAQTEPEQQTPVWIDVLQDGQAVEMELEAYITGVVLAEMPADFQIEALKAQAVVARTYAKKRMDQGSKHEPWAVCTESACCQGYRSEADYLSGGGTEEALEKVALAVAETSGLVLTYDGELIDATYFSCSGGSTEAAMEVWGADVPYLQAVESPGEESAVHYTDQVVFTLEEFSQLTGCTGAPENWLGRVSYTQGGGVDTLELCGAEFQGTELRALLGLMSTDFTIEIGTDTVTITTQGFGHRVGMSQYGAQAMAQQGSTFDEILAHYYTGTILSTKGTA